MVRECGASDNEAQIVKFCSAYNCRFMVDVQTRTVLLSILGMLRQQAEYLHRQHGWMIAVADTVRDHPEVEKKLEEHPFYNQGPRPDVQITHNMLRNIDILISQLEREQ